MNEWKQDFVKDKDTKRGDEIDTEKRDLTRVMLVVVVAFPRRCPRRAAEQPSTDDEDAPWASSTNNPDESTGSLARLFACSLALLIRSLALPCLLRLLTPLHSLGLANGAVNDLMAILSVFFSILDYSVAAEFCVRPKEKYG